jgi:putative peptide zinc metalloprotease protein
VSERFLSDSWYRVARLRPRLKPHLRVHAHRYAGRAWYVIQDPAGARTHRVSPGAYRLLGALDGARTVDAVWTEAALELGDGAATQDETIQLLAQLHAADLLVGEESPLLDELVERLGRHRRARAARLFKNPTSIILPLWDPDRFLGALDRALRLVPGPVLAALWCAAVLPALVLAVAHWDELTANLSDQALSAENVALIAAVFPVIKLWHELGHGLMVKRFGGAVHDCGVMLLVFYPVPYVDASASIALRDRRQRALVGAGGMLAEALVAAGALYLWLAAEPGLTRALAYNAILIAGVSTIVVNANPLLRFDGYFILCDLVGIPNLGSRANRAWRLLIERRAFGVEARDPNPPTAWERAWFLGYAPAAYAYRLTVLATIALFVAERYFAVGVALALWTVAIGLVVPGAKALSHVATSPGLHGRRRRAILMTGAAAATVVALLLGVPLPHSTVAEGVVWLAEESQVRAGADGFVGSLKAAPGAPVRRGDPLLAAENPILAARVDVERQRVAEVEARLEAERFADQSKLRLIEAEMEAARGSLRLEAARQARLQVAAAADGVFVVDKAEDLPGRWFREGQVVATIAAPRTARIRAVVAQADIDLVRGSLVGVEVMLADRIGAAHPARIVREVPAARDEVPSGVLATSGGGRHALDPRDQKRLKVLERLFQFDLDLADGPIAVPFGTRAYVKFAHAPEPLGQQIVRRFRQLFLARLDV